MDRKQHLYGMVSFYKDSVVIWDFDTIPQFNRLMRLKKPIWARLFNINGIEVGSFWKVRGNKGLTI